jgi:integrase
MPPKWPCTAYCGFEVNPQLFRHLAAMIMLLDNPAAHGQVQRVLAHKSLGTTQQYYTGIETRTATQRHDKLVLTMRAEPEPFVVPRRRRGARG